VIKRIFDCVVAAVGLVLVSPLLLLAAALIKLDSPGPVFFRQFRVGRHFRPFRIYKFRTMRQDAERLGGSLTADDDPRVTRVGHWLRQLKIDELPQLLNVLEGDMSLVGPRPEVARYVDLFRAEFEHVLQVRPGLTDPASLKYRNEGLILRRAGGGEDAYVTTILPDKLRIARSYVERASLPHDLSLIGQTLLGLLANAWEMESVVPTSGGVSQMSTWMLRYRRVFVVLIHLALITFTNYSAFWLRFDGEIPDSQVALFVRHLPLLLAVRSLTFVPFRLYEGLWRYTGIYDLRNIVLGVLASSGVFFSIVYVLLGNAQYPRSIYLIDAMLLVFTMGGVRLARRAHAEVVRTPRDRRVLIYGAGNAGEMVVRDMLRLPDSHYEPVGFIDDNATKVGRRIHGVPVLGSRGDLARIIGKEKPSEILVALPGATRAELRDVVKALQPFDIPITTLPNLHDILSGRVAVSQIRQLQIEDLLERSPVGLDGRALRALIEGRRVLVTGAGGSIGSELCRQIGSLEPESLILLERYENSLFHIVNDLADRLPHLHAVPVIGDITDVERLDDVMRMHRPHLVFHAAAHKHVPLMELNPCEAVKNNVSGTRSVAEAAARHGVERLIMILSDKAVNPSSVMGATKRVAELVVRALNHDQFTRCITVRFGNVLGSNGSVVPRFIDQIKAGGPVTVTHPDIRRYFMLIPEAVQLVLQAAAVGDGGAIYVLEMGEQIKLVDMARNLIRLSGFVPDVDIPIVFTGLRPGEKIAEELFGSDEEAEPSRVPSIMRVRPLAVPDREWLVSRVMMLEELAREGAQRKVVEGLTELVPSYEPGEVSLNGAASRLPQAEEPRRTPPPRIDRRNPLSPDRRTIKRGGRRRQDQEARTATAEADAPASSNA
jgi:FlaA1/EpsC-like NDP-sugar epimerase/lipopolysaccharide/colanic/teichoic acid biosynthesis glycosyltransferase